MRSEKSVRLNLESLGERVMPSVTPIAFTSEVDTAPMISMRKSGATPDVVSSPVQAPLVGKWFYGQ
jgi:hypothetical protein